MKPVFQMPFMCHQTWRASTYQNHSPDSDSIDLKRFSGSTNISAGEQVFASADGTVVEAYDTNDSTDPPPYGSVVTIDHGDSWKTQYVHLNDALSVKKDDKVVCGQRIGSVGTIAGLEPHLHYVQMKNGNAVRVTFNGTAIAVHAGAKKPDGTFPTQNLTSANCPTGITKKVLDNGTSVTCKKGAGLRATVKCFIPKLDKTVTKHGSWVGAKGTSKVQCPGSQEATGFGYEIS
jgi:murein DD-endopeptidase MepM/ murein hydrolase activator NlpD